MSVVYLLCGKVGCGKSTYAQKLKKENNAVILSCDTLMLTLFDDCIGPEKHKDFSDRCKKFLYAQAEDIILLGHDVVLDFGFWSKQERTAVKEMFLQKGIKTKLVLINTSYEIITSQLEQRNKLVEEGKIRAYHIDEEKRNRFDGFFETPSEDEIDIIV